VKTPDGIEIPGYFLAAPEARTEAVLDRTGRLVTPVSRLGPGVLPALELPRGTWLLATDPPIPQATWGLRCDGPSALHHTARAARFALDHPETVSIAIAPADDARVEVRSVTLTRQLETPPAMHCDFVSD
jgi:hypothetical protein